MRYTVDRENKTIIILSEDSGLEEFVELKRMYEGFTITKLI